MTAWVIGGVLAVLAVLAVVHGVSLVRHLRHLRNRQRFREEAAYWRGRGEAFREIRQLQAGASRREEMWARAEQWLDGEESGRE